MKILTTSDLDYVSGGNSYFCDESGDWFSFNGREWVPGLLAGMAYDAAVAAYRSASNRVSNANEDNTGYANNCDANGSCW